LKLPRQALIAFRKSGGLHFNTREVIVYNDGRVISHLQGKFGREESGQCVSLGEVAGLKETIVQSGFFELPRSIGRPSPDGYAYELIARLGRRTKAIEFFDGSIPSELSLLLGQLKFLMLAEDTRE
jgi:hypothetical protein